MSTPDLFAFSALLCPFAVLGAAITHEAWWQARQGRGSWVETVLCAAVSLPYVGGFAACLAAATWGALG